MSRPHQERAAIAAGSLEFRRSNRAVFLGGFSTFALLYCVQPLMPLLSRQFALSAAQSSWSLSVAAAALAVSLLLTSALSDRLGRKRLMTAALALAAGMTVLCACAQDYWQLLLMRAALGAALGGVPAIAMAYLGEEIESGSLGLSMGLFIAGSAFGGMAGRLLASVLSDWLSWRAALAVIGALGAAVACEFWRSLPPSRNFTPHAQGWRALRDGARRHFADPGLPWLFCIAFLCMGSFVSMYNYMAYRLLGAPFDLRQGIVGALAFFYPIGIYSSVWAGKLVDRLGRGGVLWSVITAMLAGLLLTLADTLWLIVPGMAVFTFGYFATHSVASSWVSRRAPAPQALASALYLFFHYLGSSVLGSASGLMWAHDGWPGVVAMLAACVGAALLIARRLRHLEPAVQPAPAVAGGRSA